MKRRFAFPPLALAFLVGSGLLAFWGATTGAARESAGSADERAGQRAIADTRGRSAAIKDVLPSSVRVAVELEGKPARSASGVVIGSSGSGKEKVGYVITNAHVAAAAKEQAPKFEILVDRKGKPTARLAAKVIALGQVPDVDLAVLEVPGLDAAPARFAADDSLELGDDVIAIGAPFGKGLSVSSGIVSQLDLDDAGIATGFKTDAPIGYGASGGGIFRVSDGALLAVVEGYRTVKVSFPVAEHEYSFDMPMPGETFAAPVAKVRAFLRDHGLGHLAGPRPAHATAP
ncbi:S1C family serine protease [Vulgatibacter incomptus]|uniref:Putative protease n=1 Tax=Vulgatibacter incomptus TaxID=1391653 RepID=A0A0K1P9Y9_9BACT|nr:S1C family serine protease [Vulgatibacter incomptus]AKU90353.1 putative protease [Vulgatibacter incomptus]